MILGEYKGSRFFLYELIDPRSGECRYVGSSDRGMIRPRYHGFASSLKRERGLGGSIAKARWIEELPTRENDQPFDIRITREFDSSAELWALVPAPSDGLGDGRFDGLDYAEEWVIRVRRVAGARLTNIASGGPSPMLGRKHTSEARGKISAAGKRPASIETRAKISETLSGHEVSESTRAKIGAANKGRTASEEVRRKQSIGQKQAWSDERRRTHSERLKKLWAEGNGPGKKETRETFVV